jgi:hypothetical protein
LPAFHLRSYPFSRADTKQVIAEELSDSKDGETVKNFLKTHLDTDKPVFIVTDLYRGYKGILEEVFGDKATHQLCLLHLNKLIVTFRCLAGIKRYTIIERLFTSISANL